MDTKTLRQKVLDLAIRGKLVPQDPNDEPASVLLERIRAEKQQMVKDGKLKAGDIKNDSVIFLGEDNLHYEKFPDGSVKCIEDELPFDIPEGWGWCRLSSVCLINPKNNISNDIPVSFVPMTLIQDGFANQFSYMTKNWKDVKKGFTHFAENDVGFAKITPCFENRKSTIFRGLSNGYGAGTTELYILRTIKNTILPEYLLYLVKSESFISSGKQTFSGAVGQQRVGKEFVYNYLCPLPPLPEQHRIADKISEIMSVIDNLESDKNDILSAIQLTRSKILDLAIRGKLVPQDPNDEPASVLLERIRNEKEDLVKQGKIKRDKNESVIFRCGGNNYFENIPDSWTVATFSQLNFFQSSSINPLIFQDEYFELYSVPNFEFNVPEIIRGKAIGSTKQVVEKNDVLLCKINPRINRVWTVEQTTKYRLIASSEWIVFRNPKLYAPYIRLYFSSSFFREILLTNVSGVGGSLMRAQPESVKKYPLIIPPLNEQKRIADKVSRLFSLLDLIEENIN